MSKYNIYSKKKAKSIKFTKKGPVDIASALKRLPPTTTQSADELAMVRAVLCLFNCLLASLLAAY